MTLDEIRSNAPDGATHYTVDEFSVSYIKEKNGIIYAWVRGGWMKAQPNRMLGGEKPMW